MASSTTSTIPATAVVRGHYAWKSENIATAVDYDAATVEFGAWLAEIVRAASESAWAEGVRKRSDTARTLNDTEVHEANPYLSEQIGTPNE